MIQTLHWELATICKVFLVPIFKSHTWIDVNLPSGGYPIPLLSDASGSENDPDDEDDDILDALNAVSDEDDDMSNNGDDDNGDDNDSWEDLDVQEENL